METKIKGIDWELGESLTKDKREEMTFFLTREGGLRNFLIAFLGIALPAFILFRGYFGAAEPRLEAAVVVSLVLCYIFLRFRLGGQARQEKMKWLSWLDWFLFLLSAGIGVYILWSCATFGAYATDLFKVNIIGYRVQADAIAGVLLLLLVLEINRRTMGWSLVIFTLVFLAYVPLRPYLPGILKGAPTPWNIFLVQMVGSGSGIYGDGTRVLISTLFIFMIFGTAMLETKVGTFFFALAKGLVGNQTGGPAKVSVLASGTVGMVSSSGIANVVVVGTITIPLMKATGFKAEDAAAIETVASTGGSIVPPVMSSIAFLIAEFLQIPYSKIIIYAIPGALMYYGSLFAQVHFKAKKLRLGGISKAELPSVKKVLWEGGYLTIPLILLVTLLIMGYSVGRVGFVGVMGMLLLSFVRRETRVGPLRMISLLGQTSRVTAIVSSTLILVGIITGIVSLTGLDLKISMLMTELSSGSLLIAALLSGLIAFLLGMPLPALPIYLYGLVFCIPTLIDLGANPVGAHLFFLYWANIGGVTPPVCVAAFTAAGIAGAPLMKTGWLSAKMAYIGYILPFLFIFAPAVALQAVTWTELLRVAIAFVGIVVIAGALEGYFIGDLSFVEKALLLATGLSFILGLIWHLVMYVGVGVFAIVLVWSRFREKKRQSVLNAKVEN